MATSTQSHIANKMTADEAAKISAEKTRVELEKLQKTIKQTNAFEMNNAIKTPSDVESICSTIDSDDEEEISTHPVRRSKQMPRLTMEDRMYNDNQKLWKKNQELKSELEKTNKQLRYLQFEHNNKCLEITSMNNTMKQFNSLKVSYFYTRVHTMMLYFIMMSMVAQFVYEYPVIDIIAKHSKELTTHIASVTHKKIKHSIGEYMNKTD